MGRLRAAVCASDFIEYAQAAGDDGADFEADATRQVAAERGALQHQCARPVDFEAHQRPPVVVAQTRGDLQVGDIEAHQVFLRQVDTRLLPVDGDILPVVDELQRGADAVRTPQVLGRSCAEQVQQQAPDRVGRAAAVVDEFGVGGVARLRHVLRKGIEQIAKKLQRQVVLGDDRAQAQEDRMYGRLPGRDGIEFRLVAVEQAQAFFRGQCAFVGEVVGAAREDVNRRHRFAQGGWQQEGCDGKVLVVVDGHGQLARGSAHYSVMGRIPSTDGECSPHCKK
jgi:hypothetical protein